MMHSLRHVSFAFSCLFLFASLFGTAHAARISMFELDKIPDLSGFMLKDGKMFAVFNDATVSLEADELYGKLLSVDFNNKKRCTKVLYTDSDKSWTSKPCISARREADGSYIINIVIKYEFPDYLKDEISILKSNDHVKERRLRIRFEITGLDCSADVIERSFVPLDGTAAKPSRTGPIGCKSTVH